MTTSMSVVLIIILSLLSISLFKNNNLRARANGLLKDKNNALFDLVERLENKIEEKEKEEKRIVIILLIFNKKINDVKIY